MEMKKLVVKLLLAVIVLLAARSSQAETEIHTKEINFREGSQSNDLWMRDSEYSFYKVRESEV